MAIRRASIANIHSYTYTIELFPFSVRAKGTVVVQTFSRFATFFNQFVNPIGLENIGWKYYLVYTVWLAVEALSMTIASVPSP
jgi:hypothetical protein